MKNLLKNIYLNMSGEDSSFLTPQELAVADNAIHIFQSEIDTMNNILNEEVEKSKENPNYAYNLGNMKRFIATLEAVTHGMNYLSSKTMHRIQERNQSFAANILLTPENSCEFKSHRQIDRSSMSILPPHTVAQYKKEDFPVSFIQCLRRVKGIIEDEKLWVIFSPIKKLLGDNFILLYSMVSKIVQ